MDNLSKKVLHTIKEKNIKPKERWKFLFKNYFWIFSGFVSVLFGAFASSIIFDFLLDNDWDIHSRLGFSPFRFTLLVLPYFWVISFALFVFLADLYLKNTKNGYRFSLLQISALSVLFSLLGGFSFYKIGFAHSLEDYVRDKAPTYHRLLFDKEKVWMQPQNGLLIGEIKEKNNDFFILEDFNNNRWKITTTSETFVAPLVEFEVGEKIKMIGKQKELDIFEVEEIRPTRGRALRCGQKQKFKNQPRSFDGVKKSKIKSRNVK